VLALFLPRNEVSPAAYAPFLPIPPVATRPRGIMTPLTPLYDIFKYATYVTFGDAYVMRVAFHFWRSRCYASSRWRFSHRVGTCHPHPHTPTYGGAAGWWGYGIAKGREVWLPLPID
jgi:hypothetical protein